MNGDDTQYMDHALLAHLRSNQMMVDEFHTAFGLPVAVEPAFPDAETRALRIRLLREEVKEYLDGEDADDLFNVAKELADVLYIAYGTAAVYGLDLDALLAEVHISNMSKLGLDGKPIYREDGKVMKGPNYRPPDIAAVLGIDNDKAA